MEHTISIAMIVKDEGEHLRECLTNIQPLADEICIVDTGSRDDSLAVAREFGARTSVFIWCDDFSAARNESLRLCRMDWILYFDADERIDPSGFPEIRAAVNGPQEACFWLPIRNYTNTADVSEFVRCDPDDPNARGFAGWYPTQRVRLFPNGTNAKFEGKVHELIGPSLEQLGFRTTCCNVPVHHYPLIGRPQQRVRDKQESYLRLGHEKVRSHPENARGYAELGDQYGEVGDYARAAAAYREALKRDPADPENLKNLGGMLHLLGRHDEAKQALLLATELNPSFAEAWRNLGVVYADEKEWSGAAECFQRALEHDPNWLEGYRYLSVALEGLGRLNEAAAASRRAFEALPGSQECLQIFMHQMLRLKRRPEARDVILAVAQQGAEEPQLLNAVGELFFYDDLFEESKAHFRRAGELGLAGAYNNLGVVLFAEARFDEAKHAFEQCLELDPGHRGARSNLEKVLNRLEQD